MSAQSCFKCGTSSGLMSRNAGQLLCSGCMFDVTLIQSQLNPVLPQSPKGMIQPVQRGLEEMKIEEGGRGGRGGEEKGAYWQQIEKQELMESLVEEGGDRGDEEPMGESQPEYTILCQTHNQPAQTFCFCSGRSKAYLCPDCVAPHYSLPNVQHQSFPLSADPLITSPADIPLYQEKQYLLARVEKLKTSLKQQKQSFDEVLKLTLEAVKNMLDVKFTEIASEVDSMTEKYENALELAVFELKKRENSQYFFSKTTELFIHQREIPVDQFVFFNFTEEYYKHISFTTNDPPATDRSFEQLLTTMGEMCVCQSCEQARTMLGLPRATPWKCLNCGKVRKLEKACMECGCGQTWVDYLGYKEVEVVENNTKWVCRKCKHKNEIEERKCTSCGREAGKSKKSLLSSMIPSLFMP